MSPINILRADRPLPTSGMLCVYSSNLFAISQFYVSISLPMFLSCLFNPQQESLVNLKQLSALGVLWVESTHLGSAHLL